MTCIEIFLAIGGHDFLHLLNRFYVMSVGEELASLFSDVALAYFFF